MQTSAHQPPGAAHPGAASWTGCWTACSTPPFWWTPTAACLYISASSFPDPSQRAAVVGQHISVLDQLSPFEEVLRTGQPRPDLFLELHGRPCISSLFPVLDGERVIGVVGTITVRNLGRLKKVLSQLSDQAAGFRGLYQDLARVDSGYRLEDFVGGEPPGGRPAGQGPEGRSQR